MHLGQEQHDGSRHNEKNERKRKLGMSRKRHKHKNEEKEGKEGCYWRKGFCYLLRNFKPTFNCENFESRIKRNKWIIKIFWRTFFEKIKRKNPDYEDVDNKTKNYNYRRFYRSFCASYQMVNSGNEF